MDNRYIMRLNMARFAPELYSGWASAGATMNRRYPTRQAGANTLSGAFSWKWKWETTLIVLVVVFPCAALATLLVQLLPVHAAREAGLFFLLSMAGGGVLVLLRAVRQQKKLHAGGIRLNKLIDYAPDGILLVEPATLRVHYANQRAAQILGVAVGLLCKGKITDAATDPQPDGSSAALIARKMADETLAQGDSTRLWRVRRAGGDEIDVQVRSILLPGETGVFSVSIVDVTERNALAGVAARAEESLRASEIRFRHLAKMSADWYWETGLDDRFSLLEGGVPDEGTAMRQLIGRLPWEVKRFLPISGDWDSILELRRQRLPYRQIISYQEHGDPAGEARVLEVMAEPMAGENLAYRGYRGVVRDITRRRATERRLSESEERFRKLVELSQDGIVIHEYGRIEYANLTMHQILKMPAGEQLTGTDVYAFFAPECVEAARRRELQLLKAGDAVQFVERQLLCRDGTSIEVEAAGCVIEISGRKMIQAQMRDISARKWTEREILRLNAALEETVEQRTAELRAANDELEAFSYTVAHDLRAPLRAIDGYSHMLQVDAGGELPPDALRDIDLISASARKMARLIDGLLSFARLGRGGLQHQKVDTGPLVAAVMHDVSPDGKVKFETGQLPGVWADAAMLRQVWINLIGNAVKFSAKQAQPCVQITCRQREGEWLFGVRDNGAGFDAQYAGKLFGVFQRLHSAQEFDGTGVGLAIVRRIVERHGGQVWAESEAGAGAFFQFTLPVGTGTGTIPEG